jgi:hypothetical protein
MSISKDRQTALAVLEWCKKKWGLSKFQDDFPKLRCYKKGDGGGYYGHFDDENNTIVIYLEPHPTVEDLVETVIHEYTHYKQNVTENYDNYVARYKAYNDNPYEKTANNRATRWKDRCIKDILKQLA